MDREEMLRLREHYDHTDTSEDMEDGTWETDVDPDPMIGTSLRLPKSLLDWVRVEAEAAHIKPTAFIRQCLEERRASAITLEQRVHNLEHMVHAMTEGWGVPQRRRPPSSELPPQRQSDSYENDPSHSDR